ncbi:RNA-binding protein Raly-like [Lemur catta]|uniref:RNA-binding protein Raly-like n=1 Tax=Lemur catta TaxID=9447 RepID=UPI001E26675F|nr:RNA-binding protein Raly-like [Lemur catta]
MGHDPCAGAAATGAGRRRPAPKRLPPPGPRRVHAPRGSQARARAARPPPPAARQSPAEALLRPAGAHPPTGELAGSPLGPPRTAVRPLGSRDECRSHLDMAREPTPGPARPGQKRQQGTAIFCSNYDLNYDLYRENAPYRVHEYQRIPPLINRVPVKLRRTHMGLAVKSSFSPHKASRNSPLPPAQIKLRTEELRSIRGELSQIKAQVDSLLLHVEHMDRQRDQPAGTKDSEENRGPGSEGSSNRRSEPRGQRASPEADSSQGSTDTEQAVKNPASDQEGSQ